MKQLIGVLVLGASVSGCAFLNKARSGDLAGAAGEAAAKAQKLAEATKEGAAKAEVACKPLNERVGNVDGDDAAKAKAAADALAKGYGVGFAEEKAIGGAIAIGFGKSGKGLYADITDKDPAKLKEKVDAAKGKRETVKLAASEKNDLNIYVALVGDHVAAGSTRPGIPWTFGVIDNDDTVNAYSTPGGYILVTTGLLKLMENEAQLAGVLSHEVGHVTARHAVKTYAKAKASACNVAVTAYYIVEGLGKEFGLPEETMRNAEFGKTMLAFAKPEGVDLEKDPSVNVGFMNWFTDQIINFQNLTGNAKEDEYDADRIANELMAAAGYDTKELDKIINKLPSSYSMFAHHPSNSDRVEALGKLRDGSFGSEGGKAPALPANLALFKKPAS